MVSDAESSINGQPIADVASVSDVVTIQNSSGLPLIRAPPDALRYGFYSASEDVRPIHEVQRLQTLSNWEIKMSTVEQVYGKAAAMRLRTEKAIFEQFTRLPGLPSSHAGLDTLTGADDQIDFADFLNGCIVFFHSGKSEKLTPASVDYIADPNEHPENTFRVHEAMEVKLAIF